MSNAEMWSPVDGPSSEATVVEVFVAWLTGQGWDCTVPTHGNHPDIIARHPDGRHLVAEAKGLTRNSGTDVDTGYGQLLRRMQGGPDTQGRQNTEYALVVAKRIAGFALRVPSEVRRALGIAVYTVDANGKVELVEPVA